MWFHNRVPVGPNIPCLLACIYTYGVPLPLLLAAAALCCYAAVAAAAAAVRHRVPDGKNRCWFILNLIPSIVFLFKHDCYF